MVIPDIVAAARKRVGDPVPTDAISSYEEAVGRFIGYQKQGVGAFEHGEAAFNDILQTLPNVMYQIALANTAIKYFKPKNSRPQVDQAFVTAKKEKILHEMQAMVETFFSGWEIKGDKAYKPVEKSPEHVPLTSEQMTKRNRSTFSSILGNIITFTAPDKSTESHYVLDKALLEGMRSQCAALSLGGRG